MEKERGNGRMSESFSVVGQTVTLIATAFAFTLGLAMNNALQLSFAAIPLPNTEPVVHAWIYFAVIFPLVILVLYLLFRFTRYWKTRGGGPRAGEKK